MTEAILYPKPAALAGMPARSHYVIEASAGTGKTFLIEHRVVDLLLSEDVTTESLLIVTFTEKATAELSTRIRTLLSKIAATTESCPSREPHWRIDAAARRTIDEALVGLERMAISTIHGFCHRLIGEHAFAAGKQLRQDQIPDVTAFDAAYRAILREQLAVDAVDSSYLEAWLSSGRSPNALRDLLYKCARERAPLQPPFDADGLMHAARVVEMAIGGEASGIADKLREAGVHASTARSAGRRLAVIEKAVEGPGSPPALLTKLEGLRTAELAALLESNQVRPDVGYALTQLDQAWVPLQAAVATRFVPRIIERLERDKHEHGLFDYDDMLGLLWQALEGPQGPRLAAELRARYPFALIDEFQDTDELQWDIFRRIYVEENHSAYLAIVGDPKQAIYGFRGGDVYTYLRAREELLEAGARIVTLDENYRSTAELISAFNSFFDPRDGVPFFSEGIDHSPVQSRSGLLARETRGGKAAAFDVVIVDSEVPLKAAELKERVRSVLLDEIAALLRGERGLVVGKEEDLQPVRASDCFVLTRSTAEAQEVADHLRNRGIPCALFQQEGLLHSRECVEVRDLLAGIARPNDRSARLRAWQTRFFAVGLGELGELGDIEPGHPLNTRLFDWRQLADRLEYEQLFSAVLDDSGFIERELMLESSERALTNVLHLFELLLEEVSHSRCDIHELVRRLDAWIAEAELVPSADRNLQRLESDADAVQIMTVHKSKGLEAKVVFLYGGYGSAGGHQLHVYHADGRRCVHIGKPPPPIARTAAAELAAEDQRLAYVALTRAAARIVVPAITATAMPKLTGYYGPINERLWRLHEEGHHAVQFRSSGDEAASESSGDSDDPTPVLSHLPEISVPRGPDLALTRSRRGFVVTSYTRLKRSDASTADDRAVAFDERIELAPDDMPAGARAGICVHELLERVDFRSIGDASSLESWAETPGIRELFRRVLHSHGWPDRHVAAAQSLVWRALRTPLSAEGLSLPPVCLCDRNRRELEFLYPLPVRSSGYVRGFIDLVFEVDGRIYVLDWKTDVLRDYSLEATTRHVARNYTLQLELYAIAIARLLGDEAAGRFGGLVYAFVRGMSASPAQTPGIYLETPDLARLKQRYQELGDGQNG